MPRISHRTPDAAIATRLQEVVDQATIPVRFTRGRTRASQRRIVPARGTETGQLTAAECEITVATCPVPVTITINDRVDHDKNVDDWLVEFSIQMPGRDRPRRWQLMVPGPTPDPGYIRERLAEFLADPLVASDLDGASQPLRARNRNR